VSSPIPGLEGNPRITWEGQPLSYARQVMTGFIQGLFINGPEEYLWDADAKASRIFISSTTPVDAESFGQRPCIAIGRSGLQWGGVGIGGIEELDSRTGAITKGDLVNGSFILHHISTKEAEAEDLAFFTAEMTWMLFTILNQVHIQTLGQINIGEPGPVGTLVRGETKGLVNVPLVLPFRMARRCRMEPLGAPILKSMTMRILASAPAAVNFLAPVHYTLPVGGDPANIRTGVRTVSGVASQPSPAVRTSLKTQEE
jgi:hypothetical protein